MSDNEFYSNDPDVPEIEENIARMPSGASDVARPPLPKEEDLENVEEAVNNTNQQLDQLNEMVEERDVEEAIKPQDDQDPEGEQPEQDPQQEQEQHLDNNEEDPRIETEQDGEILGGEIVHEAEGEMYVLNTEELAEGEGQPEGYQEQEIRQTEEAEHDQEKPLEQEDMVDPDRPAEIETEHVEPEEMEEVDPEVLFQQRKEHREKLNEEISNNLQSLQELRQQVKTLEDQEFEYFTSDASKSKIDPSKLKLDYAKSRLKTQKITSQILSSITQCKNQYLHP